MTLFLVRHGRTAANASGLLLGRLDPPLDDEGERQAAAVGDAIHGEAARGSRVISSPLVRCRTTAAAIAERLGLDVEVDERWIELDYGELDGVPLRDVPPDLWERWRADPEYVAGGGESLVALGLRVRAAADELAPDAATKDVVVVSHVSPIKAAVAWTLGVGDDIAWRLFLSPASITRVAVRGRHPSLVSFNDVSHLA